MTHLKLSNDLQQHQFSFTLRIKLLRVLCILLLWPFHWVAQTVMLCCLKTVARSPNATNKFNGRLIFASRVVRFANNEIPKYFRRFTSVTLAQGLYSLSCKTSYLKFSKMQVCVLYYKRPLWYITDDLAVLLPNRLWNCKSIWGLKFQSRTF